MACLPQRGKQLHCCNLASTQQTSCYGVNGEASPYIEQLAPLHVTPRTIVCLFQPDLHTITSLPISQLWPELSHQILQTPIHHVLTPLIQLPQLIHSIYPRQHAFCLHALSLCIHCYAPGQYSDPNSSSSSATSPRTSRLNVSRPTSSSYSNTPQSGCRPRPARLRKRPRRFVDTP